MELSLNEKSLRGMKMMPGKVLIDWDVATEKYGKSELIRPDTYRLMHYTGDVIGAGEGVYDVKVGDRVKFDRFSNPKTFYFENKRYAVVYESDIEAVIPPRLSIKEDTSGRSY